MSDPEENGAKETEEKEYNQNYKEVENTCRKSPDDTSGWRESEEDLGGNQLDRKELREEEEEENAEEKEKGEEEEEEEDKAAAGVQEETSEERTPEVKSTSQYGLQGTFLEILGDTGSKQSLRTDSSGLSELFRGLSSNQDYVNVAQVHPEEQQMGSSAELGERAHREAQNQLGQEERDLGRKQGGAGGGRGKARHRKRISYFLGDEEMGSQAEAGGSRESLVSSSTEDTLFQKDEGTQVYPLALSWLFGWNSSLPVFYIRERSQRVLLYVCGHTAVIYNVPRNTQHHLQGHRNVISCLCVSEDRRWIATADKGPGCLIIIWDSFTGIPVHTIFDSCPQGNGIRAIAISHDAKYLATVSDADAQEVCIWRWTLAVETPACTLELPREHGFQNYLTFNPANNKELVSNSKTQTIYYWWHEEKDTLVHSAPLLVENTFNKLVGKFSQSIFHPNSTQILSATLEGKLVVWDIHRCALAPSSLADGPFIRPCKLVHLQREAVSVLTTADGYIVTGDIKGNIKFYDQTLSIANWYSHLNLSCIRTLSFSPSPVSPRTEKSNFPLDCTLKGDLFVVRNFIIATSDATVYHLTTDGTRLEKLFVEPKDAVCAISCHPYQPLMAVGSACGVIKVWDYEQKKYLFSRVFEKGLGVQSLTHNPEGALLGAGFTEGTVYILDAMSLQNEAPEPFKYSRSNVTHVSFSHDSQYMATADVNFTVAVYMMVVRGGRRVWEYLARLRSHRQSICSLLFGVYLDSNEPRLLSLGRDRLLIEYNLSRSHKDHLEVLDIHHTDQGHHPTCMVWYPLLTKELFLLVCDSGYKVKLFNSTTKMCSALDAAVSLGGEDLTPFYGLVPGGREGKFYRIRSQGIDTMETRKVSEHICLSEVPFVMRAIGFYPSEEKIEDMFNEIKFSEYADTGKLIDRINLPDFLKVFVNHRSPFGNTLSGIRQSFEVLGTPNAQGEKAVRREVLLQLLLSRGEHMTQEEMTDCFATLSGLNPEGWKSEPAASASRGSEICLEEELPDEITAEVFASDILGLTISEGPGEDGQ
ncbi:cilia- and flagella-associated protein 251 isoform X5 [Heterocephalus glaber]|uniref:Cilia- and flagella-associated protein 251 n=1 Tax=Heterocephalus glaber TaxID=10181 RepID=A0AAX6SW50_HETGA|nr:cilia- and flagella-associated protein 251 isoform X5 [Heterocephalus glaber]